MSPSTPSCSHKDRKVEGFPLLRRLSKVEMEFHIVPAQSSPTESTARFHLGRLPQGPPVTMMGRLPAERRVPVLNIPFHFLLINDPTRASLPALGRSLPNVFDGCGVAPTSAAPRPLPHLLCATPTALAVLSGSNCAFSKLCRHAVFPYQINSFS